MPEKLNLTKHHLSYDSSHFLDQKTIDGSLCLQPEETGLSFQVQFAKRKPGEYAKPEAVSNSAKEPHPGTEHVLTRHGTSTEGSWQTILQPNNLITQ